MVPSRCWSHRANGVLLVILIGLTGCAEDLPQAVTLDLGRPDLLAPVIDLGGVTRPGDFRSDDAATTPPPDNTLPDWTWFAQGSAAADRGSLGTAFQQAGYTPPAGTFLMAARVVDGLGQPTFQYFSLGESGFTYSANTYWPASTVKLMAAVGALSTLGQHGLTGAASLTFADSDGAYSGTVQSLYDAALSVSDNVAYNRLMEIAGFDEMNDTYLVPAQSLPQMVLQRRYTIGTSLRTSPSMAYSEGGKSGTIPKRVGTGQHPTCPDSGNCITLFELLDVMRRVTLHDEIPTPDRFPLAKKDVDQIRDALQASSTFLEPGASEALGHPVKVLNKIGQVWDYDRLDHGLVIDQVSGERFLVAWSMPYNATSAAVGSELTRQTLLALRASSSGAPPLQHGAGTAIAVHLTDQGPGGAAGTRACTITVTAPGADAIELWLDHSPLPAPTAAGPAFTLAHDLAGQGEHLLVVRTKAQGKVVGYRAATIALAAH